MPASDASTQLDATRREPVQELDDVVFVDDRVGELYERGEQLLFSSHERAPFRWFGATCTGTRTVAAYCQSKADSPVGDVGRDLG